MWTHGSRRLSIDEKVPVPRTLSERYRIRRINRGTTPARYGTFEVDCFKLFVAMARVAARSCVSPQELVQEVQSAFLRYQRHFSDNAGHLCLQVDALRSYKDAERTAWAARIGDTVGSLYMEHIGFPWFAHMEELLENGASLPPGRQPDYAAAKPRCVEFFECKGSFGSNEQSFWSSAISDAYRNQVHPWLGASVPTKYDEAIVATSGHALGALLDQERARILVAHTAPMGAQTEVEGNCQAILRPHYAAWFQLMGLSPHAFALRERRAKRRRVHCAIVSRRGRRYAVPIATELSPFARRYAPYPHDCCATQLHWEGEPVTLGLEEQAMRSMMRCAEFPDCDSKLELHPVEIETQDDGEGTAIFSDGAIAWTGEAAETLDVVDHIVFP